MTTPRSNRSTLPPRLGELLGGRYRLLHIVGRGGGGTVILAVDQLTGDQVAVKHHALGSDGATGVVEAFHSEVRALARLDHPVIVGVRDLVVGANRPPCLVMDYVEGVGLHQCQLAGLDWPVVWRILDQLLAALAHAHARSVVHRDLKPSNVVLVPHADGRRFDVRLLDFGLAAITDRAARPTRWRRGAGRAPLGHTHSFGGTLPYMAPEQAIPGSPDVGPTTDLYALGVLFHVLVYGCSPFRMSDTDALLSGAPHRQIEGNTPREGLDVPPAVRYRMRELLAFEPWERDTTAADLRAFLAGWPPPTQSLLPAGGELVVGGPRVDPKRPIDEETATLLVGGDGDDNRTATAGVDIYALREPRLVGRQEALTWLLDSARQVQEEGRGRVCVIEGPAGIGKTRLAREAAEQASENGWMQKLLAWHSPSVSGPDSGVRGALASHLRRAVAMQPVIGAVVAARLDATASPAEEFDALLDTMTAASASGATHEGQEARFRLHEQALRALCALRPVALVLDAAQWAVHDEALQFCHALLDNLHHEPAPILVIVTQRHEGEDSTSDDDDAPDQVGDGGEGGKGLRATLLRRPEVSRRRLGPLDEAGTRQLVRSVLPAAPEVVEAVVRRASGNPLFAYELSRFAVHAGMLKAVPVLPDAQQIAAALPRDIAEATWRRLKWLADGHPHPARSLALLGRIALLGAHVPARLLHAFIEHERDPVLVREARELIRAWIVAAVIQPDEQGALAFESHIQRDALLDRLSAERAWPLINRLAAETKRAFYPDGHPMVRLELASHLEAAGAPDEAYALVIAQVRPCLDVSDSRAAESLCARAAGLLDRAGADRLDGRRVTVACLAFDARWHAGPNETLRRLAAAALTIAQGIGDSDAIAHASWRSAALDHRRAADPAGQIAAREAIWETLGGLAETDPGGWLDGAEQLALLDVYGNRPDACAQVCRRGVLVARAAGSGRHEAAFFALLGWLEYESGRHRQARAYARLADRILCDIRMEQSTSARTTLAVLGAAELALGNHDAAIDCFERNLQLARRHGESRHQGTARLNLASALASAGELAEAMTQLELAASIGQDGQRGQQVFIELPEYRRTWCAERARVLAGLERWPEVILALDNEAALDDTYAATSDIVHALEETSDRADGAGRPALAERALQRASVNARRAGLDDRARGLERRLAQRGL